MSTWPEVLQRFHAANATHGDCCEPVYVFRWTVKPDDPADLQRRVAAMQRLDDHITERHPGHRACRLAVGGEVVNAEGIRETVTFEIPIRTEAVEVHGGEHGPNAGRRARLSGVAFWDIRPGDGSARARAIIEPIPSDAFIEFMAIERLASATMSRRQFDAARFAHAGTIGVGVQGHWLIYLAQTLRGTARAEYHDGMEFIRWPILASIEAVRGIVSSDNTTAPATGKSDGDQYLPIAEFPSKIHGRLRQATAKTRRSRRVRMKVVDGVNLYSLSDAQKWWPSDVRER